MKDFLLIGIGIPLAVMAGALFGNVSIDFVTKTHQTQPAIQTVIVSVRGCDVIQHIQGDRLIAAHNAADQPKTCKVMK